MIDEFPAGLFFLRHCKSEYNAAHKISGQANPSVISLSIDAAALEVDSVQYQDLTIISSPLARCLQTVLCLMEQYRKIQSHLYIDGRIMERRMGCWEGRLKADVIRQFPQHCYCGNINPLCAPPGGETIDEFAARIVDFTQSLKTVSKERPILICAHNQSLKLLKYQLIGHTDFLSFWTSCSFQNGKVERIY